MLSADHTFVTLDLNEDDCRSVREVSTKMTKLKGILDSGATSGMLEGLWSKLHDFVHDEMNITEQEKMMEVIDIDAKGVAQLILRKMVVDQRQTEIEHLLGTVAAPAVIVRQPTRKAEEDGEVELTEPVAKKPKKAVLAE